MSSRIRMLCIAMITVAILGEWRIILFEHDFRFSLAVIFFAFILIWRKDIHPLLLGSVVGCFVVLFRIGLDIANPISEIGLNQSFMTHIPAFFFYFAYSLLFLLFRVRYFNYSILLSGGLLVCIEILSNVIELWVRGLITGLIIQSSDLNMIIFIALIRSFSAAGFYTFLLFREAKVNEEIMKRKNDKIISIISDLYSETIQLQNSISDIDKMSKLSFETYNALDTSIHPENKQIAKDVLWIAVQTHELQKNYYRINAGLQQIISDKLSIDTMNINELVVFVKDSNKKYAQQLGKQIMFETSVKPSNYDVYLIKVLPLVQNIVINAVEAIPYIGTIQINIMKKEDWIEIHILDDGPGIPDDDKREVFQLGYSTKFDAKGRSSTGIGLYYSKQIVDDLGGNINIKESTTNGTHMTIELPCKKIIVPI